MIQTLSQSPIVPCSSWSDMNMLHAQNITIPSHPISWNYTTKHNGIPYHAAHVSQLTRFWAARNAICRSTLSGPGLMPPPPLTLASKPPLLPPLISPPPPPPLMPLPELLMPLTPLLPFPPLPAPLWPSACRESRSFDLSECSSVSYRLSE